MSSFGEYMKNRSEKDHEFFYGKSYHKVSNQYFKWQRVTDNDNIIVVTNDIVFIKGSAVLVVDYNKGVYIKDWAIRKLENYEEGLTGYAIKLSRKYYKTYTFKSEFSDYIFDHEATFDDWLQVAKDQDGLNLAWKESKIL